MRKALLAIAVCSLAAAPGCIQAKTLEKLGMSLVVGVDGVGKERFLATTVMQKVDPSAKEKTQVVASTGFTSKGSRIASNRELSKKLVGGQIRVVIYSRKLAERGILDLVDTLSRDPMLGTMIYITVSDKSAQELLTHRYPEISNVGTYIYEMLRQNIETEEIPSSTLHEFMRDFYSPGQDPVVPLIRRTHNEIMIKSLALFKADRMVGEATPREGVLLKLLNNRAKSASYESVVPSDQLLPYMGHKDANLKLVFEIGSSRSRIRLVDPAKPSFRISVAIDATLQEISSPYQLGKPNAVRVLEDVLGKQIASETERLIRKLQKLSSDAVGFGETYRSSVKRQAPLKKHEWHDMFRDAEISTDVKVNFIRTGVIE